MKKIRVIVEEIESKRDKKIQLLKKAISDPLFNADIEEVKHDFLFSDKEVKQK